MVLAARWLLACMAMLTGVALGSLLPLVAQAADRLPLPEIKAHVTDQTNTLSAEQMRQLEKKLTDFESRRGTQIIVVMVPTTEPEDVFSYAQRLARATAVGRADVGDGLVMVVAKNDRRMHIATARALEGAIPDMIAKRIIDQVMAPAFRQNDFAGGINAALDHLFSRIEGEALPLPAESAMSSTPSAEKDAIQTLLMFLFIGFPIVQAVFRGLFGRAFGILASGLAAGGLAWFVSGAFYMGVGFFLIGVVVAGLFQVFGVLASASNGSRSRGGHWGGGSIGSGGGWSQDGGGGWSSGGGGSFGGGGASGGW